MSANPGQAHRLHLGRGVQLHGARARAGSCPDRARSPGLTGGAGSGAWRSRNGAPRRPGGSESGPGAGVPRAAPSRQPLPRRSPRTRRAPPQRAPGWSSHHTKSPRDRRRPGGAARRGRPHRPRSSAARPGASTTTVSKNSPWTSASPPAGARRPGRPYADGPVGRCRATPRRRGTPRTWRRPRPSRTWAVQMLDVAFSAADVLLARLQRQPIGRAVLGVDRRGRPGGQADPAPGRP